MGLFVYELLLNKRGETQQIYYAEVDFLKWDFNCDGEYKLAGGGGDIPAYHRLFFIYVDQNDFTRFFRLIIFRISRTVTPLVLFLVDLHCV